MRLILNSQIETHKRTSSNESSNYKTNHQLIDAEPERTHENFIDLSGFLLRQIRNRLPILHGCSSNPRLRAKPTKLRARIRPINTLTTKFTTQPIRKKGGKTQKTVRRTNLWKLEERDSKRARRMGNYRYRVRFEME